MKLLRLFVPTSATKSAQICNNVSSFLPIVLRQTLRQNLFRTSKKIICSHFASVVPQSYPQYIVGCRTVQLNTRLIVYSWELLEACHKLAETMHNSYSVSLYGHITLLSTIYSLLFSHLFYSSAASSASTSFSYQQVLRDISTFQLFSRFAA